MKAKVLLSRTITPEKVLELYKMLGKKLDGKVAIKVHSGEAGNQNFRASNNVFRINLLLPFLIGLKNLSKALSNGFNYSCFSSTGRSLD